MNPELQEIIDKWQLPEDGPLLARVDRMVHRTLMEGHFGSSPTLLVAGVQYHLGGEKDTAELAELASISSEDHVLDVCSFLGGPAIQLAESFHCRIIGIDIREQCVAAANRIAQLCELHGLIDFRAADARNLPFADGEFSVVWSQGSLEHDEAWLQEFSRVLGHGGRLALTFAVRKHNPDENSPRWTLQDIVKIIRGLGYSIDQAEDISERDIEIGWKALDNKLSQREEDFATALGRDWVRDAHRKFADELRAMHDGRWGNGRIIATKVQP